MAYSGSTAASSVANPPVQIARVIGGGLNTSSTVGTGGGVWLYMSTNTSSDIAAAGFFTDAATLGMRQGDVVIFGGSSGSSAFIAMGILGAVTSTGANLASSGGVLSSTR